MQQKTSRVSADYRFKAVNSSAAAADYVGEWEVVLEPQF